MYTMREFTFCTKYTLVANSSAISSNGVPCLTK